MLDIDCDIVAGDWDEGFDWDGLALGAISAALQGAGFAAIPQGEGALVEVSVRLSDDEEVQRLNRDYRGKDKPTNVLSFPMLEREDLLGLPADGPPELLGDIALALETCAREAAEKAITVEDHATHLIVHALLHLAGRDHETSPEDARAMEELEIKALAYLGIADPYGDHIQPQGDE